MKLTKRKLNQIKKDYMDWVIDTLDWIRKFNKRKIEKKRYEIKKLIKLRNKKRGRARRILTNKIKKEKEKFKLLKERLKKEYRKQKEKLEKVDDKKLKEIIKEREKIFKENKKAINKKYHKILQKLIYNLKISTYSYEQKIKELKTDYVVEKKRKTFIIFDVKKNRKYKIKIDDIKKKKLKKSQKKILEKVKKYAIKKKKEKILTLIERNIGVNKRIAKKILNRYLRTGIYILNFLSVYE